MQKKRERKVNEFILELRDEQEDDETLGARLKKVGDKLGEFAKKVEVEQMLVLSTTGDTYPHNYQLYLGLADEVNRDYFIAGRRGGKKALEG
jgi:hypothetical protein